MAVTPNLQLDTTSEAAAVLIGGSGSRVDQAEQVVLDAVAACVLRFGWDKVTMDDICAEAGVSRATVYRMFPGGRDVLFEALRVRELSDFFTVMTERVSGADSLEELLVRCVLVAHAELVADQHLATMLATSPGETLGDLTVNGLPRIVRVATSFIVPLATAFLPAERAEEMVEVMTRLVISFYLAPSSAIDFSSDEDVRRFVRSYLLAAHDLSLHTG